MMKVSIRLKTMLGTAAIEAALLSTLILVAINFMMDSANEALNKRASTTASLFASATKDAVLSFDLASLDTFSAELITNPDIVYVHVLGSSGELLSSAGQRQTIAPFEKDKDVNTINDGVFDATAHIIEGEEVFGVVQIGIDIGTINTAMNKVKRWTISIALFEMLLVAVFSYILGIYLTKNLYKLKQNASDITLNIKQNKYDYSVKPILSRDELEELSLAFEKLSDTLIIEHQRRTNYEQKLLELNAQLEQKVEQRTQKINQKNIELTKTNQELADTQQQLVQSEKMASVGQLAAGVAHEINNPIGFVTSNLGILEEYMEDYRKACNLVQGVINADGVITHDITEHFKQAEFNYLNEDTESLLSESVSGLKRVTEIVKNLKQFSHADSLETQPCDINECIKTAINMANNDLKYHCKINTTFAELPAIEANMGKLIQVFTNLLINSGQAITNDGVIYVFTKMNKNNINIEFVDNGNGIPADKLDKIFDPFFTTKPVGEGTGLGLSICYDIIQEHEGEITVKSAEGKGTKFAITLPLERPAE